MLFFVFSFGLLSIAQGGIKVSMEASMEKKECDWGWECPFITDAYYVCARGACIIGGSAWSNDGLLSHEDSECRVDRDCQRMSKCKGKSCFCEEVSGARLCSWDCETAKDCYAKYYYGHYGMEYVSRHFCAWKETPGDYCKCENHRCKTFNDNDSSSSSNSSF